MTCHKQSQNILSARIILSPNILKIPLSFYKIIKEKPQRFASNDIN